MKKMIASLVVLTSLLSSVSAFALTPSELVSKIEFENNAKCEHYDSSMKLCLGQLCYYTEDYVCDSNSSMLEAKLKVRQTMRPDGSLKRTATLLYLKSKRF